MIKIIFKETTSCNHVRTLGFHIDTLNSLIFDI